MTPTEKTPRLIYTAAAALIATGLCATSRLAQGDLNAIGKVAAPEDAQARNRLGVQYAEEEGVPQGYAEAAGWFRLAAEQGNQHAQDNLRIVDAEKRGVTKDDTEAAPPAEHANTTVALGDADCFEKVASVDYGNRSEALENNRFRYAFQHVENHPYYRRVEDAFVGIETSRWFPNEIVLGAVYWRFVDGRHGYYLG